MKLYVTYWPVAVEIAVEIEFLEIFNIEILWKIYVKSEKFWCIEIDSI